MTLSHRTIIDGQHHAAAIHDEQRKGLMRHVADIEASIRHKLVAGVRDCIRDGDYEADRLDTTAGLMLDSIATGDLATESTLERRSEADPEPALPPDVEEEDGERWDGMS